MPIYDYKCPECNIEDELLVKRYNSRIYCIKCLKAEKPKLRIMEKQYSTFTARFVGEGFHVNDYNTKE